MNPKRRIILHEEHDQGALFDWARRQRLPAATDIPERSFFGDYMVAIPNGAHLAGNAEQRAKQWRSLQRVGAKKGVSDIMIALPRGGYCGAWIENKKARKLFRSEKEAAAAVSDEQCAWIERMQLAGYWTAVAYGFEEMRVCVEGYLLGKVRCV